MSALQHGHTARLHRAWQMERGRRRIAAAVGMDEACLASRLRPPRFAQDMLPRSAAIPSEEPRQHQRGRKVSRCVAPFSTASRVNKSGKYSPLPRCSARLP